MKTRNALSLSFVVLVLSVLYLGTQLFNPRPSGSDVLSFITVGAILCMPPVNMVLNFRLIRKYWGISAVYHSLLYLNSFIIVMWTVFLLLMFTIPTGR